MRARRAARIAVLLILASAAFPARAAAQVDCAALGPDKAPVCKAIVAAQDSVSTLADKTTCAVRSMTSHLERILSELPVADGLLPEEFKANTTEVSGSIPGVTSSVTVLFFDEADAIVLDVEGKKDPTACYATDGERSALRTGAEDINAAVATYNQPRLLLGAARLRKLADTWSWVITDGFGQFPWERAVNDVLHRQPLSIYRLPKWEGIFVHPSVGAELTGLDQIRETRGSVVLFVEPLGVIRYRFDVAGESRGYWGLSSLVVLGDDTPPGLGAIMRYNKFALGAVWHLESADAPGRWALAVTVELLEKTQAARKKLQRAGDKANKQGGTQP